ncbi:MAG: UPF0158 family protein [Candidatus Obscuribacterales bacterium]|nr:UPF0158 family protein [Candidatus Obscuribacterales bacterium]
MTKIAIDMEQLVFSFEDDCQDNVYYLDLENGEIRLVHRSLTDLRDLTDEIETDHERFLYVPKPDPKKLKEDLRDFIDTVDDDKTKILLDVAMDSPHALSGFRKILQDKEGNSDKLKAFLAGRTRLRVRQWLEANSIDVDSPIEP